MEQKENAKDSVKESRIESESDDFISLKEWITKQEASEAALAAEAEAELSSHNWGREDVCTYEECSRDDDLVGYLKQAVFSCKTCIDQNKERSRIGTSSVENLVDKKALDTKSEHTGIFGFCFGCSMKCHLNHEVFELFEKRHFRCDCGTPRSGCTCMFDPAQLRFFNNEENRYNHNFEGRYCWCDQNYDPTTMLMFQCVVCEDWFHKECIEQKLASIPGSRSLPDSDTPFDFVCIDCLTSKCPFLFFYEHLMFSSEECKQSSPSKNEKLTQPLLTTLSSSSSMKMTTDTMKNDDSSREISMKENIFITKDYPEHNYIDQTNDSSNKTLQSSSAAAAVVVVVASTSSTLAVEENSDEKTNLCCALKDKLPLDSKLINMLWRKDWRKRLCRCQACILMYENLKVSFLISEIEEEEDQEEGQEEDQEEDQEEQEQPNTIKILPTTTTTTTSSSSSSRRRRRRRRNIWNDSSSLQEITIEKTPHVVQMELARGINDFVSTFREFFGKAAENGKTAFGTQVSFPECNCCIAMGTSSSSLIVCPFSILGCFGFC